VFAGFASPFERGEDEGEGMGGAYGEMHTTLTLPSPLARERRKKSPWTTAQAQR
jgi:hypothetical protein